MDTVGQRKANRETDVLIPIYTTKLRLREYKYNKTSAEPSTTLSFELLYIDGFIKISELLNYISIIGKNNT